MQNIAISPQVNERRFALEGIAPARELPTKFMPNEGASNGSSQPSGSEDEPEIG
jgi:hypothetical protein